MAGIIVMTCLIISKVQTQVPLLSIPYNGVLTVISLHRCNGFNPAIIVKFIKF